MNNQSWTAANPATAWLHCLMLVLAIAVPSVICTSRSVRGVEVNAVNRVLATNLTRIPKLGCTVEFESVQLKWAFRFAEEEQNGAQRN